MRAIVRGLVALFTIAGLCGSGCVSRSKYQACQAALAQCQAALAQCQAGSAPAGTAAFTVTIENDGFAQFAPMNNLFWNQPQPSKYYGGFLVQLVTMKESNHVYSNVDLTMADGTTTELGRSEAEWVNIVCEPTPGTPISADLAALLIPDGTPAGADHVLHRSILPDTVSLLTIWRAGEPVSVQSSPSAATSTSHGHDQFVFSSPIGCAVEVWQELIAPTPPTTPTTTYPPGQVKAVRIRGVLNPTPHGGVHQPWWFK